jgi:hypothetical protein
MPYDALYEVLPRRGVSGRTRAFPLCAHARPSQPRAVSALWRVSPARQAGIHWERIPRAFQARLTAPIHLCPGRPSVVLQVMAVTVAHLMSPASPVPLAQPPGAAGHRRPRTCGCCPMRPIRGSALEGAKRSGSDSNADKATRGHWRYLPFTLSSPSLTL